MEKLYFGAYIQGKKFVEIETATGISKRDKEVEGFQEQIGEQIWEMMSKEKKLVGKSFMDCDVYLNKETVVRIDDVMIV